jgi:hypothetical protein
MERRRMNIVRLPKESQRAVVERVLRDQGEVATFDVLYHMADAEGRPSSITRLAAIVCSLREDGWDIETRDEPGTLAVYRLKGYAPAKAAAAPVVLPVWICLNCGTRAASEPEPALGGMGYGSCPTCHGKRYFARRAAA